MRLVNEAFGHKGKPLSTAKGLRWQVRWVLDPGAGRKYIERKRTNFHSKGEATSFREQLRKAAYGVDDWRFDHDGQPTQQAVSATTVLSSLDTYVQSRWVSTWSDSQRTKVRGRFFQLIAVTCQNPKDRDALLAALVTQRLDRGTPPEPTTTIEWAARYLRVYALNLNAAAPVDERLLAARRWLEANSMPISALDVGAVTRIRNHFIGPNADGTKKAYNTQRSYWQAVVVPYLTWLTDTGLVDRSPNAGQPRLPRDTGSERPDLKLIPDPRQMNAVARYFNEHHGATWELWVLISTVCALRMGESLNLRYSNFFVKNGRWFLRFELQTHRTVAAVSDTGSTRSVTKTKSVRHRTPPPRVIPIPGAVARRLVEVFGDRLGQDDGHLFVGPRGAVGNDTTVREWWNAAVAAVLAPGSPHLAHLTPHSMRHAGMTYWFARGADQALIQKWGGWESLKQMQDTYHGVIDGLEEIDYDGIDEFYDGWLEDAPAAAFDADPFEGVEFSAGTSASVVNLEEYRSRRQRGA